MIYSCQIGILMLLLTTIETYAKVHGTRKHCKLQMQNCSIKNECFSDLRKDYKYIKECAKLKDEPTKSYYYEEHLTYAIEPSIAYKFPGNRTHSVYISDSIYGRNPTLVPGCCGLGESDKCVMPATMNKSKTFFVIFPYNKSYRDRRKKIYCFYRVYYDDAPTELCDDDQEIIDNCMVYKNGEFRMKYRFKPLDMAPSKQLRLDRCYFTLSTQMVQKHGTKPSNDSISLNADFIASMTWSTEASYVKLGNTTRECRFKQQVDGPMHHTMSQELSNSRTDDFMICFGYQINPSPGVFCERTRVIPQVWKRWHIGLLATTLIAVIISVTALKICREYRQIKTLNPETMTKKDSDLSIPTIECTVEEDIDPVTFEDDDTNGSQSTSDFHTVEPDEPLHQHTYVQKGIVKDYIPRKRTGSMSDGNIIEYVTWTCISGEDKARVKDGSDINGGYIPKSRTIASSREIQTNLHELVPLMETVSTDTPMDSTHLKDSTRVIEIVKGQSVEVENNKCNYTDTEKALEGNTFNGYIPKYLTRSHGVVLTEV